MESQDVHVNGYMVFDIAVQRYWVTSHISALVDTESMLSSFRHMLRGVCDGEVLLTEEMKIKVALPNPRVSGLRASGGTKT